MGREINRTFYEYLVKFFGYNLQCDNLTCDRCPFYYAINDNCIFSMFWSYRVGEHSMIIDAKSLED